jgi:phage terminase large subunit-like protein
VSPEERWLLRAVHRLAAQPAADRRRVVRQLTITQRRTLDEFWPAWRHEGQGAPAGDWPTWLLVAGRGFGKTRAGAEWVSDLARRDGRLRIALVGATLEDALNVMVEGHSGLKAVAQTGEAVRVMKKDGQMRFASGATAFLYSGACPEKLRGPEHHFAWCDEIAKWRHPQETWDNLQLGLRLGARPRTMVTTTPRSLALLRELVENSVVTRGRMRDNLNLPPAFVAGMEAAYRGTRKGREELDGELLEDVEGALWTRELVERCRRPVLASDERAALARVVIGVDPPASAQGDACGMVACGVGEDGLGYVLEDCSASGLSPEGWAARVVTAARDWEADCVMVERNQGGDMVKSVLASADPDLPVRTVFSRYGKGKRAEPVAMLFEQGRVRVAGAFAQLEDELCAMTRGGCFAGRGRSPDRADAMVFALTELMLGRGRAPAVRAL